MRLTITGLAMMSLLLAGGALAQESKYSWTGYGSGSGSTNCSGYKMTINVTVANGHAIGLFQQEGRPQRNFDAVMKADGSFKGEAIVGGGNKMSVDGKITPTGGEVVLDGYCRFGGPLKKG